MSIEELGLIINWANLAYIYLGFAWLKSCICDHAVIWRLLKHDVDKGGVMTGGRGLLVIRYCLYSVLGVTPSCKHVNFPIPMILLLRLVFYLCSDFSSTTTNGSLNIIWAWSSVSYH